MAIELRGFDDLQNDMVNMAYALDQGPGVSRALKAGAVPIEEQMLSNASTDPKIITDALHSSIHTGKVKQKRGGGKQITIGVHHSENGAYYANPVEFGHGGPAPARRPARWRRGADPCRWPCRGRTAMCAPVARTRRRPHGQGRWS